MTAEEALKRSGAIDENFSSFALQAHALGVHLTERTIGLLRLFAHALLDANDSIDLTAITNVPEMVSKHFLDSLTLVPHIPPDATTLVDVGTGAGFPGLVIAIVRPDIKVALVESIAKKAVFLEKTIESLELPNVTTVCARAEDVGRHPDMRETFDVGVARAVAETATLAEYVIPLIKIGGVALFQKSDIALPEIKDGAKAITAVGATLRKIVPSTTPAFQSEFPQTYALIAGRSIVTLEKTSPTPDIYPRRIGVPTKRPVK